MTQTALCLYSNKVYVIEPIHTKMKAKASSLHNADIPCWSSIKMTSCNCWPSRSFLSSEIQPSHTKPLQKASPRSRRNACNSTAGYCQHRCGRFPLQAPRHRCRGKRCHPAQSHSEAAMRSSGLCPGSASSAAATAAASG